MVFYRQNVVLTQSDPGESMASDRKQLEYAELLPAHGCFLVCVSAPAEASVLETTFAESLYLLNARTLSIGKATLGGPKAGSAFLIGDLPWTRASEEVRGCSCSLKRSPKQSEAVAHLFEGLRRLQPVVPSIAVLVHSVRGNRVELEEVSLAGKEVLSLNALERRWPHLEEDVRYLLSGTGAERD